MEAFETIKKSYFLLGKREESIYDNSTDDTDKFIRIVQGYIRDHRPELNQAILA